VNPWLRFALAFVLLLPGIAGGLLWLVGSWLRFAGIAIWMFCHRRVREPGCACAECREFGP